MANPNQYSTITLEDRFFEKVALMANGCWIWTGSIMRHGYGLIQNNGKSLTGHRVSYELFKGPVPKGLVVDHTCHDPRTCDGGRSCIHRRCVNPDHLEAVTKKRNSSAERSCASKSLVLGRENSVKRRLGVTHCVHGHEYTPENTIIQRTKRSPNGCRVCRICYAESQKRYKARTRQEERANRVCFERKKPDATPAYTRARELAALRTHCPHGHEYTPENSVKYGRGRSCRECIRLRSERGNKKRTAKRIERLAIASTSEVQLVLENPHE